jgi:uncharacterized protein YhhL (DUF1145 family)
MKNTKPERIDEVSKYYGSAAKLGDIGTFLFWIIALVSLAMPYSQKLEPVPQSVLQSIFLVVVLIYFVLSQVSRFYLIPKAETKRRMQMLSDAFDVTLSHEKTQNYYNNLFPASFNRLGANTMENSLFSSKVAAEMLSPKRLIIGFYIVAWFIAFSLRHNNLDVLTWITQLVFSGEIIAQWLSLEFLRCRHERTYDQLHDHFLHSVGSDTSEGKASILNYFAEYESAKASAGLLLSTKVFNKLNPSLTGDWKQIRQDLKMED